jgi:RNA polymerase sigma factor (TIGR02999 family)
MPIEDDFTVLLNRARVGDEAAAAAVWQSAYAELRVMARSIRSTHAQGAVPSATTIIHEAFLKTFGGASVSPLASRSRVVVDRDWDGRAHFFGSFARAMAQFLVDWHRTTNRLKRGGGVRTASMSDGGESIPTLDPLTDFDQAIREVTPTLVRELEQLQIDAPEVAEVVWLRSLAALSVQDTSVILGVPRSTVSKRWNLGRAMLRRRLGLRSAVGRGTRRESDS